MSSSKTTAGKNDSGKPTINILLVDDMPEAREGVKKLLQFEQEFKVIGTASNGREAVQQAKELKPDIVIMDINMPDMDGLEAASRITKALPATGVIMMSVQDDTDYMQRAMLAGARFFLPKPPDMDKLYSTIRSVYEQYGPIRQQMESLTNGRGILPQIIEEDDKKGGDRAGHVIVVYSPTGGAGCTSIAISLASGLMKEGIKTLLVDGNLQFGDVGAFLNLKPQSTISDLVENLEEELDIEYFENIVMTHDSGMKVLLGPPRPMMGVDIRDQQPESVPQIIEQAASYYDFIVVDTSRAIDNVMAGLFDKATKIVVVVNPNIPSIKNTRLTLEWFDQSGFPPDKVCLVINKAITDARVAKDKGIPLPDKIQSYLRRPVEGILPLVDDKVILSAINRGVPVIASDRDTSKPLIKQLYDLSNHLYRVLMGETETVADPHAAQSTTGIITNFFRRR
jgi:pilus assembly protein CpaE